MVSHPPDDDFVRPLRDLVDRQVVPLVDWYQRKKRWPRRIHKSTTAVVIVLGAMIPIATVWSGSPAARIFVAILGVIITTVTSLAVSFDWYRRWRIFSLAQSRVESELAKWEFAIAQARMLPPEEGPHGSHRGHLRVAGRRKPDPQRGNGVLLRKPGRPHPGHAD